MIGRILAAAISILCLPGMLLAQGVQTISWTELGSRANGHKGVVSLKSGDSVQGKVVRSDGRSLTVRVAKAVDREILPPEIALVRVEPRRGWAGRLIGLAVGAALETLIGWGVDALRTGKPVLYRIEAGT